MSFHNYPDGFSSGITVRGIPLQMSHPGEVFWVNNSSILPKNGVGGSDGNPGTFHRPWATIDFAIGQCTAARGDIVFVMPNHTESISTTTFALAGISQDVSGVAVVGLGRAAERPTITIDTDVDATWSVTANYCSIVNMIFTGNFLSVKSAITNSAGAGMTVEGCLFQDTSAIKGLLAAVTTTVSTNSDDLWFANNKRVSIATTTPGTAVKILNTSAGVTIIDNVLFHSVTEENVAIVLDHAALVVTHLLMARNNCYSVNIAQTADGFLIKTSATTGSGIVRDNVIMSQDPGSAFMITSGAVQYGSFNNLHTGDDAKSGIPLPALADDTS